MYKKQLSTKQKGIAKLSGNPKTMDASDFKKLREIKSKNKKRGVQSRSLNTSYKGQNINRPLPFSGKNRSGEIKKPTKKK